MILQTNYEEMSNEHLFEELLHRTQELSEVLEESSKYSSSHIGAARIERNDDKIFLAGLSKYGHLAMSLTFTDPNMSAPDIVLSNEDAGYRETLIKLLHAKYYIYKAKKKQRKIVFVLKEEVDQQELLANRECDACKILIKRTGSKEAFLAITSGRLAGHLEKYEGERER